MIVMNLELDNIYGFKDFKINFSYPKKIVNSIIENEYLEGRPNFRYKKAIVLLGANATGKTSLGRALLRIFAFLETGDFSSIQQMVANKQKQTRISIDFVNIGYVLHRLTMVINPESMIGKKVPYQIGINYETAKILKQDTYEKAVTKLAHVDYKQSILAQLFFSKKIGPINSYMAIEDSFNKQETSSIDQQLFLKTLIAVIGTLDPTLTDISILEGIEDSYVIRRDGQEIIIQKGRLANPELLSSGTVSGIEIAILLARIISNSNGFYFCDEHFSFIHTELEKRIFGIMVENLQGNEQLIFTTHNSDMMDLLLPKHSYAFMRKQKEGDVYKISTIFASDILKRNTDSVRCAAENDVFSSIPDESKLDSLSNLN